MLIGNQLRISAMNPMHQFGAALPASQARAAWMGSGKLRNFWAGEATVSGGASIANKYGYPSGMRHPASWCMAPKAGGLAARYEAFASMVDGTLTMAQGINLTLYPGTADFTFTVPNASLQLIVSGTGTATIVFTVPAATVSGALWGTGTSSLTFTPNTPLLGAIIDAIANGTITVSQTGTLTAIGHLAGDIVPYTELSPESLAAAVWSAIASSYNDAGTMGEKLNGAGSAGNPWTEVIEGTYTAAEILRVLAAVAAGKTDINSTGSPVIVTFRDLSDTKDRIVADMVSSERTAVTLDAT